MTARSYPNRSFLPAETPRSEREAFARDFLAALSRRTLPSRQDHRTLSDPSRPTARLRRDTLSVGSPPLSRWRVGRGLSPLRRSQRPRRRRALPQLVPGDLSPGGHTHHCILVDGQALFRAIEPHGIWTTSCSRTRCTCRYGDKSGWHKAFWMLYCGELSVGPRGIPLS